MAKLKVHGVICPNDYAWYYRWFEEDCTCPKDVEQAIAEADGETLEVEINSPGGEIASGSAIYTMLKEYGNVEIRITGEACSAASVIAMAGHSTMSPTSLMMVHCVSSGVYGNHSDMEKMAEVLSTADQALCTAYMSKTGMSESEALAMMEAETWLTAAQAKERGLVDEVMFEESGDGLMVAANGFALPTQEQMDRVRQMMEAQKAEAQESLTDFGATVAPEASEDPVADESDRIALEDLKRFLAEDAKNTALSLARARAKYLNLKGEINHDSE